MNPWADHLVSQNALEVIAATPQQLESLIRTLGPQRVMKSPAPGKWSAHEIVSHLADGEIVFAFRLRQTLAEKDHIIQPFDQDRWATVYGISTTEAALAVFASVRRWNLDLIRAVIPGALTKKVTHPERGEMTFQTIVETMAGHDLNHIRQIERIAAQTADAAGT